MRAIPSPNFDSRPKGCAPDMLVLHYTGMTSGKAALARLTDPQSRVSAHYLIDEDGAVIALVDEENRAWHAGLACWAGERDINGCSLGIELVNPGHEWGYRRFPEAQMAALEELAGALVRRWSIPPARVLGHSDVAPARRQDPGELFDWARLAGAGIGLWPPAPADAPLLETMDLQTALARFGYDITCDGLYGAQTRQVVAAFQRHFRPHAVTGLADAPTCGVLARLLEMAGQTY